MLLVSFAFIKFLISMVEDVDRENLEETILANVVTSSSNIEISGNGNFLGNSPVISQTTVSDFNVRLSEIGDKVKYSVKFCNLNDVNLIYEQLFIGDISCRNGAFNSISCDDIKVNISASSGGKILENGDIIVRNSCILLSAEVEFIGNSNQVIDVLLDEYSLMLKSAE